MSFERISVIGLGYIGLPTAAIFAARKKKVIGVDISQYAVDTINRGEIHIVEPELDMLVHASVTEGYLRATTKPEAADAFLIAVPTPFKEDHEPDLSYIRAASQAIAPVMKAGDLVILESTSPVGATEQMAEWLAAARPDLTFPATHGENSDIRIAHCPERVLPGHVLRELVENDRIIGGLTKKCSEAAVRLYKCFVEGECIITDARTAEMCKLTENSFRDVNIAFANELSMICDKLGVNVRELIRLANHHPRVNILQPGAGVGGHCIAVDPWFIVSKTPEQARLIRQAREVNDHKPQWVIEKIKSAVAAHAKQTGKMPLVAVLGLAFKPDIDDLRESPALSITQALSTQLDTQLLIVEPHIESLPQSLALHKKVDLDAAIEQADIMAVLVKHRDFVELPKTARAHSLVIDFVGLE
ncbi:UDP-N-acetyl-D-mannosamine dehydrogenase [Pseudomonas putida]|uniref:UDP-N-acetyl-D-mannosamine dehydrogenase n=1 Tax=Pseudomonas putida TaxID=303 RepID=UPI001A9002EE|nr:UDP-N-acetyl-D-mannosamine dehydrogenase [Pseudomonas putida]MBO0368807.1 UDP-N-acetyl-D-mannosamine dehydrogenase [Pseudomonas putida]